VLNKLTTRLLRGCLLTTICVFTVGCGRPDIATSQPMDAVERELELSRHRDLLERIAESADQLSEFSTDGCSGGLTAAWTQFSESYPEFAEIHGGQPPWQGCCVTHDQAYHLGAADAESVDESFLLRRDADLALRACVIETGMERSGILQRLYDLTDEQVWTLYESIGDLMYRAVRLGGVPCSPAPWRWGYGWPECGMPPTEV